MLLKKLATLSLCFALSFSLVELSMQQKAHAGMITTVEAVTHLDSAKHRAEVQAFLQRDDIQGQLVKMGVSPEEALKRMAVLSDDEVRDMSLKIEQQQAGGLIVEILVITVLVLLVVYLARRV